MFDNMQLPSNHLLYGKGIANVGGGPARLTLARLLQMRNVVLRVFGRDAAAHTRLQCGSLDLRKKVTSWRSIVAASWDASPQRSGDGSVRLYISRRIPKHWLHHKAIYFATTLVHGRSS